MWTELLAAINARPSEPLAGFRRGDLCKVGSNCLKIVSRRRGRIQTICLYADGSEGGGYDLAPDVLAIRLSQSDVEAVIAARRNENIRPFNVLDGLAPALSCYLAAVKQLDHE